MYTWLGLDRYRMIFTVIWTIFALAGGVVVSYALFMLIPNTWSVSTKYDLSFVSFVLFELVAFIVYEKVSEGIDEHQRIILRRHYDRLLEEGDGSEEATVAGLSYQPNLEDDPESQV